MLKRHIFTKDEMLSRGASLCGSCHGAIHSMFDNKTLALELNTIDKLLAQEKSDDSANGIANSESGPSKNDNEK
jgi:hypothetical protein